MIFYLAALAAIALSPSLLMAGAWMVRQCTGNSGWVDTEEQMLRSRGARYRGYQSRTSPLFPLPSQKGVAP
jgi:steroid 5-alpha reductase family enzyme